MFKRIVAPLDGSRLSSHALPYVTAIAKQFGSEVVLVRAVNGAAATSSRAASARNGVTLNRGGHGVRDVHSAAHAKRYLSNQATRLKAQGVNVAFEVLQGEAGAAIIDFARSRKASLVVMMSHGRGGTKGETPGAVADSVMRHSAVPVMVIHPEQARTGPGQSPVAVS